MNEKLKPCPLCGSKRVFPIETVTGIQCIDCGTWSLGATESLWNTRPLEDALRKQSDECEESRKLTFVALKESDKQIDALRKQKDNIKTEVNLEGTYVKYLRLHAEHEILIAENDILKKKIELAMNALKGISFLWHGRGLAPKVLEELDKTIVEIEDLK
jgi:hypothetical protein